jgi:hypothetical protein
VRIRVLGVVAAVVTVALAVFAAAGLGGEGPELRSVETGYSVEPRDVHRVTQPSTPVGASALGEASKKRRKVELLYFETEPMTVPGQGTDGAELPCPKGKVVTGYFLTDNTDTFLGLSAPASTTRWLIGVKNTSAAPTPSVLGIVCATGVR